MNAPSPFQFIPMPLFFILEDLHSSSICVQLIDLPLSQTKEAAPVLAITRTLYNPG